MRSSQPLAVPISSFPHDFNIELRSKARSRQRWLSLFSLGVKTVLKFTSIITVLIWAVVLFFFGATLLTGSAVQLHQAASDVFVILFACCAIFLACFAAIRPSITAGRWMIGMSTFAAATNRS